MPRQVYIGDATAAAGFRLAGLETVVPAVGEERAALDAALPGCALLLVSARVAAALPNERRAALEAGLSPLFAVLPDGDDPALPTDPLAGVLGQLGVET